MDDLELMQKIREGVKDGDLELVLIRLVSLRRSLRELSDLRSAGQMVSGFSLGKVDFKDLERTVASIEDEELKKELGYLLNLGEDIKSGKLLRDLLSLSEMEERMHILGYLAAIVVGLTIWAYRFLPNFILALVSIVLLACGYMFLKTFLSRREILKRFAARYKLK